MCEWQRFWDKVQIDTEPRPHGLGPCWVWIAGTSAGGRRRPNTGGQWTERENSLYGSFKSAEAGTTIRAHIWIAWRFGIIDAPRVPPGMNLDHLCENTLCVSPWHLELVPKSVNLERITRRAPIRLVRSGWHLDQHQLDPAPHRAVG